MYSIQRIRIITNQQKEHVLYNIYITFTTILHHFLYILWKNVTSYIISTSFSFVINTNTHLIYCNKEVSLQLTILYKYISFLELFRLYSVETAHKSGQNFNNTFLKLPSVTKKNQLTFNIVKGTWTNILKKKSRFHDWYFKNVCTQWKKFSKWKTH